VGSGFIFSFPGRGAILTSASRQLRHWLHDIFYLHAVGCPYSTATSYELVAWLSLWEGLQVV